jgi:hypothetical protein
MRQCAFDCGQPVDTDDEDNYVEVTSWVNGPKLDGPKLRQQTGRVAHKTCVDKVVHGQAPDQPDLFDEVEPHKPEPVEDLGTAMGHPGGHYG